jgi:hypothetical protein
MSALSYLKDMLPSFETDRLKDNITNLSQEVDKFTVPAIDGLVEVFPTDWEWKDEMAARTMKKIESSSEVKMKARNPTGLEIIQKALHTCQDNLPFISLQVDKMFKSQVSKDGLTLDKTTILQYAECAEFFIDYTRVLANYITAAEVSKLKGNRDKYAVGPKDMDYLRSNLPSYITAIKIMCVETRKLKMELNKVPSMSVSQDTYDDLVEVAGHDALNPLGFASLPWPISMFFRMGLTVSNFQVDRYQRAEQEAKALQYRSLILKDLIDGGQPEAYVEAELEDVEERMMLVRRDIEKKREKFGVENG